jgi:acylphosphatase
MPTYHLIITGKVQGVWYRESARKEAERFQITGWIRNNPDGSVEAVVTGQEEALREFTNWCRKGPLLAKVSGLVAELLEEQAFPSFEVRK